MLDLALLTENGPVENLQVAVLIVAALLFLKRSIDLSKDTPLLSYCLTAAVLPMLGAARELSFGRVVGLDRDVAHVLKLVICLIALGMIVFALVHFLRSAGRYATTLRGFILHRSSMSIYLGLILIGAASLFDKAYLGMPKSEAIEEVLELVAFCFILRSAMILKTGDRVAAPSPAHGPATALAGMSGVGWQKTALQAARR